MHMLRKPALFSLILGRIGEFCWRVVGAELSQDLPIQASLPAEVTKPSPGTYSGSASRDTNQCGGFSENEAAAFRPTGWGEG